jgi:hypothetical protein
LKSLSSEFSKVTIQTKKLDPTLLLVKGPLIWILIVQSVFASGAIFQRELKQNMTKLSLPGSNDNYGQYLQSLSSSLILSPMVQDAFTKLSCKRGKTIWPQASKLSYVIEERPPCTQYQYQYEVHTSQST